MRRARIHVCPAGTRLYGWEYKRHLQSECLYGRNVSMGRYAFFNDLRLLQRTIRVLIEEERESKP